jgi:alpha-tubulin suppressor-like RCC1 family protein
MSATAPTCLADGSRDGDQPAVVEQLTAGPTHTCALTRDHDVYCWGKNDKGQIGDGTDFTAFTPQLVKLP